MRFYLFKEMMDHFLKIREAQSSNFNNLSLEVQILGGDHGFRDGFGFGGNSARGIAPLLGKFHRLSFYL